VRSARISASSPVERPRSIPDLELSIRDALAHDDVEAPERLTFEAVASILRNARRSHEIGVVERTIIVLQSKRRRRENSRH